MRFLILAGALLIGLGGCSEYRTVFRAGTEEAVKGTQEFNDTFAGVLYRMPGAMTLGAAIRTLTPQQLTVQIAALGGPSLMLADECMGRIGDLTRAIQSVPEPLLVEPQQESNEGPLPPLDLTPDQFRDIQNALPRY